MAHEAHANGGYDDLFNDSAVRAILRRGSAQMQHFPRNPVGMTYARRYAKYPEQGMVSHDGSPGYMLRPAGAPWSPGAMPLANTLFNLAQVRKMYQRGGFSAA